MKRSLFILSLVIAAAKFLPAANSLEDVLNQQYKNHTYTLRQSMTAPTQQYDSLGNSPTASALGPWTIYARVQIKKIKLEPARVIVEGQRVGMKFDPNQGVLAETKLKETVKLKISLNEPLESADQFHTILGHIFAFSREDFLASLPEFWRSCVKGYLKSYSNDGSTMRFDVSEATLKVRQGTSEKAAAGLESSDGHRVTAPQPKKISDPSYTKAAKSQDLEGTVVLALTVDETGKTADIRLVRPLGLGLDESAAETVKTWLFRPATKDGQSVKIEMSVEVDFRQYK